MQFLRAASGAFAPEKPCIASTQFLRAVCGASAPENNTRKSSKVPAQKTVPIFLYLFTQISTLEVILLIKDHQLIYEGSEKDSGVAWTPVAAPRTITSNSIQTDYQWCIDKSCAKPGLIIAIIGIGETEYKIYLTT